MAARSRPRLAGLVLGIAAALVLLAGCGGEGESGYGGEFRTGFLDTCEVATGGDTAVCECTYQRLEQSVPFDRAERLDRRLQDDPESVLPDDVAELIAGCVAGAVPPTIATTTSSTSTTVPATPPAGEGGEGGETTTTVAGATTTTAAEAG
jgi:hypothetical protein